jgi:hypothetical protein
MSAKTGECSQEDHVIWYERNICGGKARDQQKEHSKAKEQPQAIGPEKARQPERQ